MNRIFNKDLDSVCKEYVDFVQPIIKKRLNIAIGIMAVLNKSIKPKELNSNSFNLSGILYDISTDINQKKELTNLFLNNKKQVKIVDGKINFSALLNNSNYETELQTTISNINTYIYLSANLNAILSLKYVDSSTYIIHLKKKIENISKTEKAIINQIFDYKEFFQKPSSAWYYATKLASKLNVKICLYCNRIGIESAVDIDGSKISGPVFDHFLSQKDYPFLRLSFYNLIPSCTNCNSGLKKEIPFDFTHFLYPYNDSYEDIAAFKVYQNKVLLSKKLTSASDLEIKIDTLAKESDSGFLQLHGPLPKGSDLQKGNLNVFRTQRLYNELHLQDAIKLIDLHKELPKEQIDSIFETLLKNQGKTKEQAYEFYYKNVLKEEQFNDKPLSRFTRDLNKQLNIIYGFDHTLN